MKTRNCPHGTDVFRFHGTCHCEKCEARRTAIRHLVDSFSAIPSRWVETLAEQYVPEGWIALPMWGTFFRPSDPADISHIQTLLREIAPGEGDEERQALADSGWQEVGQTGLYALEFDGELLLGIHGAGYDFYDHHWSKLYEALGYQWHRQ